LQAFFLKKFSACPALFLMGCIPKKALTELIIRQETVLSKGLERKLAFLNMNKALNCLFPYLGSFNFFGAS
jgi:hypothetical protein